MTQPTEGGEYLYGPGFIGLQNAKAKQRENLFALPTAVAVKAPIILLVHGGWWNADVTEEESGGVGAFQDLTYAESLVNLGYTVILVNYVEDLDPLAGSGSTKYAANQFGLISAFPSQPDCVMAAAEWAVLNASKINGDASKLIILGGSTGGNISHLAAQQLNAAEPGLVKCCASLSGPTNLVTMYEWIVAEGKPTTINVAKALGAKTEEMTHPTNPLAVQPQVGSPALHVASTNAPTFLYGGVKEGLVPYFQQTEMANALSEHGIRTSFLTLPGSGHSFAAWAPTIRNALVAFLHELGM